MWRMTHGPRNGPGGDVAHDTWPQQAMHGIWPQEAIRRMSCIASCGHMLCHVLYLASWGHVS